MPNCGPSCQSQYAGTQPHTLPSELCDHIIDFLWDDPPALVACSLTCHAWLPTTRLHLFRSVTLGAPQHCARLRSLLDASAAASTGIATYVRELCILTPWMDAHGHLNHLGRGLVQLLPRLAAVEHLALENVLWNPSFSPSAKQDEECFLTFSPAVRTLRLRFVDFEHAADLLRLLAAYPRLRTVHMYNVSWNRHLLGGAPAPPVLPPSALADGEKPVRIEELAIVDTSQCQPAIEAMAALFLSARFDLRLRILDWGAFAAAARGPGLPTLLRAAGAHLQHLRIALYSLNDDVALPDDLTLAHNTQLVTLRIVCTNTRPGVRSPWVPALLSVLNSAQLEQIVFIVHGTMALDWARMDEALVLLARNLPRLEVVFKVHGGWAKDTVDMAIRSSLPRLATGGHARLDISVS